MLRDIEVRTAATKGLGVFARRDFAPGEFIFRRRHRLLAPDEVSTLSEPERAHVCQVDATRLALVGPPGCFMNHSCEPNALRRGVAVHAWRPIQRGDEITIDYRLNAIDGEPWPCACGSETCDGVVAGGFFGFDARRQAALLPYAGSFVRREYRRRTQGFQPSG